jgi:hypothetical protein
VHIFGFDTMEGDQSPKVAEIVSHLLSAELRPSIEGAGFVDFQSVTRQGSPSFEII